MPHLICAIHKMSSLAKEGMNSCGNNNCFYLPLFACRARINTIAWSFCHRKGFARKCRLHPKFVHIRSQEINMISDNPISLFNKQNTGDCKMHLINFQWITFKETRIGWNNISQLNTNDVTRNKNTCILLNPFPISKDLNSFIRDFNKNHNIPEIHKPFDHM